MKDIEDLSAEKYLQSGDVDARIAYLEANADPSGYDDGEDWEAAVNELHALEEFRDEVSGYAGAARWNNGMSLVRDSAWNEFAEDEAENAYGRAALDSGYFDLSRFTDELQDLDYTSASLDCTEFWYRR